METHDPPVLTPMAIRYHVAWPNASRPTT